MRLRDPSLAWWPTIDFPSSDIEIVHDYDDGYFQRCFVVQVTA